MTVKSPKTGSYYLIKLEYKMVGDKYLITIKDLTLKSLLCTSQEIPREFYLHGLQVDEYEQDPQDTLDSLKKRIETKIREEAHEMQQVQPGKIDRSFFQVTSRSLPRNQEAAE